MKAYAIRFLVLEGVLGGSWDLVFRVRNKGTIPISNHNNDYEGS